jgi:hypothetical protein
MRTAQKARQSSLYRGSITVGLIAYGVVHLLIAWIALQLAWGNNSEEASHSGALRELASQPFGGILLWVVAFGLFALVVWKSLELLYGHLDNFKMASSAGRAVVYLYLGISAVKIAGGSGGSSTNKSSGMTAKLMEHAGGRLLVVLIGLAVVGIGIYQIYKAVTKKFLEDLVGGVSESTILLGRIGHIAKGSAFVIVGGLFTWAALSYEPEKASGLDGALHTVRQQAFGSVLLTLMALGIACFGAYCFVWSRNAKH